MEMYLITESVKIFGEALYYFLWDNTEENITDGWDRQHLDLTNVENTGLGATKSEIKNSRTDSRELDFRIGVILSF